MRIVYDSKFLKELEKVPDEIQDKADALLEPLTNKPFHPHIIRLLAIRHRKDIYKYRK